MAIVEVQTQHPQDQKDVRLFCIECQYQRCPACQELQEHRICVEDGSGHYACGHNSSGKELRHYELHRAKLQGAALL